MKEMPEQVMTGERIKLSSWSSLAASPVHTEPAEMVFKTSSCK